MKFKDLVYRQSENLISVESENRLLLTVVNENDSRVIALEGLASKIFSLFDGSKCINDILKTAGISLESQQDEEDFQKMLQFCLDNHLLVPVTAA